MAVRSTQLHPVQRPEVAPLDGRDAHNLDLRPRLTSAFPLHDRTVYNVDPCRPPSSTIATKSTDASRVQLLSTLFARSILPHHISGGKPLRHVTQSPRHHLVFIFLIFAITLTCYYSSSNLLFPLAFTTTRPEKNTLTHEIFAYKVV